MVAQVCSGDGCQNAAAFTTRTVQAYCVPCIDKIYQSAGLEPLEPFRDRNARRRTRCLTCGAQVPYKLEYVVEKIHSPEVAVCRVCFWSWWGEENRRIHKPQIAYVLGEVLSRPSGLAPEEQELIATHEDLQAVLRQWWWPTERTRATVDLLHHDLVWDSVEHNDGMSPVVVRCRLCGWESVELPGRMASELAGRWCMCPSCNARNRGPCASDVAVGFSSHQMTIEQPLSGAETIQDARCSRCQTPRRVSMKQLNRGLVPCYKCDGAADPRSEHRVYLFRFPHWGVFKVGITNSGNDARLVTLEQFGGRLEQIITVPHRGAALWVEDQVLATVAPWPATGFPVEQRVTGWTEMWQETAPIRIHLDDYLERARDVKLDSAFIEDWEAHTLAAETAPPSDLPVLNPGDKVCFTGAGPGRSRAEWQAFARAAGVHPVGGVSSAISLLIAPDTLRATAKVRQAAALGIPVVSYADFLDRLPVENP
ncbi:hypothetical protein GCM10011509_10700 [Ornithinimicrobium pekingense]|uniref:BRCT domain-containing protein n=2 Tax=Ornithinimicrobium pekingense TaxID=384677 RepID=A0ABQ2F6D7_9MICO|nr:hypothetical protein GCM10011509_10700 [Ornithinimicrobium pekingense]